MYDFRTTPGMARRTVSVVLVFVMAALLGACGGGTGADGGAGDGDGQATRREAGAVRYTLPGEQVFPEGVAYQEETGDFFVSSTTDGTVFRGNVRGDSRRAEVFLEPRQDGRTAANGMRVDREGRLFISGADTGRIFVYDTGSGDLIRRLNTPEAEATFLNDVAVAPDGNAYVTDSLRPILFRVSATDGGVGEVESWLDLQGTPIEYVEGFNLNGIDVTDDGRYLVVVQSATGELFRVDTETREIVQIDLGGETLTNGDGLLLEGRTAYVVRNEDELIVPVELSGDYTSGKVGESFTDPSFAFPTTIAKTDGRLLVVNSQFDRGEAGPELPFTVSSVEIP